MRVRKCIYLFVYLLMYLYEKQILVLQERERRIEEQIAMIQKSNIICKSCVNVFIYFYIY